MNSTEQTAPVAGGMVRASPGAVPARFMHPDEVSGATDLTRAERREILASWASDARAVPGAPALRQWDSGAVVRLDDIRRALIALDGTGQFTGLDIDPHGPRYVRRHVALRPAARPGRTGRDDDDDDPPPCPAQNGGPHRGPLSGGETVARGLTLAA